MVGLKPDEKKDQVYYDISKVNFHYYIQIYNIVVLESFYTLSLKNLFYYLQKSGLVLGARVASQINVAIDDFRHIEQLKGNIFDEELKLIVKSTLNLKFLFEILTFAECLVSTGTREFIPRIAAAISFLYKLYNYNG